MTVKNVDTKEEVRLCANYLQFKIRRIAADAESAQPVGLSFWRNHFNETRVCPLPFGAEQALQYNGTAVPLLYRIDDDGTPCTRNFTHGLSGFRNASQFEIVIVLKYYRTMFKGPLYLSRTIMLLQVDQLKRYGAENAILLLEKGRLYDQTRWHDYLFSDFYDPYINEYSAIPTYFLYYHVFQESVLGLMKNSDLSKLQLKFHRPAPELIDFSMLVIWILAVGSVTGGGIWAFFRHRAGKDNIHASLSAPECSPRSSRDNSTYGNKHKCCTRYANFLVIVFLMILLVAILMIGFFFRTLLGIKCYLIINFCSYFCTYFDEKKMIRANLFPVTFFNIMLVAFGTMSVYGCTMALLSCWLPKRGPSFLQMIVFLLSLTLCVLWFIYRRTPYAFILLDFINVTLCLHILKSLRLPSLKWITTLMLCMFVYDAVMVFATPYMTRNGCSIMLEVATGIDCSTSGSDGYAIPPIDAALPEKVTVSTMKLQQKRRV
ncbi:unnamed protein product [Angiostrongylus costaricensis]|uniref:Uncharacterized protein n=1 Tax=Angiostrongylus costaricensis TaxID=334426 RepID=A0A0R3PHF1_ANGCS|nr:unnamed protein product [Angiostrongylus costaricensis]